MRSHTSSGPDREFRRTKASKGAALLERELPAAVVEKLRGLGHYVVTIQETGKADQALPDRDILEFATREQRAVVTLNCRHFIKLHAQVRKHAGIIVGTVDPDFDGQAKRIHEAIGEKPAWTGN